MLHFRTLRGIDYQEQFDKTLAYYQNTFVDEFYGGSYYNPPGALSKGSEWKAGYHDTGMALEGLAAQNR